MLRRKNNYYVITRWGDSCLITFKKKNTEAATGSAEAATEAVL